MKNKNVLRHCHTSSGCVRDIGLGAVNGAARLQRHTAVKAFKRLRGNAAVSRAGAAVDQFQAAGQGGRCGRLQMDVRIKDFGNRFFGPLSYDLRNFSASGRTLRCFMHKKIRMLDLDGCWNTAPKPVLYPLLPSRFGKAQQFGDLRRPAQVGNNFLVSLNLSNVCVVHDCDYKHGV